MDPERDVWTNEDITCEICLNERSRTMRYRHFDALKIALSGSEIAHP